MAYRTPQEIRQFASDQGVVKAEMPIRRTFTLGMLAGAYIAMAAMVASSVSATLGDWAGPGMVKLISSAVFTVGIVMVLIAGAELFTGNMLLVVALLDRRISMSKTLRNWALVFASNLVGAGFAAWLYWQSGLWQQAGGAVGEAMAATAAAKCAMGWWAGFTRGVLCNWLVALSVWMSYAADDVTGRMLPAAMAVATFVTIGGEHCVANMFYVPAGHLIAGVPFAQLAAGVARNLVPVTLGNMVGGGLLVAGMYWMSYPRQ
ncbi:MAG: formate/nitrite transporter family protein [Bacillota bacterium]|nr:formate/nitrite transporter family protein [Bacillota bacterium]